jgi:hypothetical protein
MSGAVAHIVIGGTAREASLSFAGWMMMAYITLDPRIEDEYTLSWRDRYWASGSWSNSMWASEKVYIR